MNLRNTETELRNQDYTTPYKYNDDLDAVIAECRAQLASVMKEHAEIWKKESMTINEYKAIRKAARKDMMQHLEILITSLV